MSITARRNRHHRHRAYLMGSLPTITGADPRDGHFDPKGSGSEGLSPTSCTFSSRIRLPWNRDSVDACVQLLIARIQRVLGLAAGKPRIMRMRQGPRILETDLQEILVDGRVAGGVEIAEAESPGGSYGGDRPKVHRLGRIGCGRPTPPLKCVLTIRTRPAAYRHVHRAPASKERHRRAHQMDGKSRIEVLCLRVRYM